ncbi:MAG: TIR domain-containing protein [Muribaculaceae bacterium]|nr:TIR domain-containing protein [Muribaculaceae bacterium]
MEIFEGFDIDISGIERDEEQKWDALVEAAIAGNVVPVIGPDILCDYAGRYNVNEFLVGTLRRQFGLSADVRTFSELAYDNEFLAKMSARLRRPVTRDIIYSLVNDIFGNPRNVEAHFKPSSVLTKLLSIKLFPFVITTSFTPVVENEMRRLWGSRNVDVLSFSCNPRTDIKPGLGDINSPDDMTRPTVYYMFGRTPGQPHRYVLTDNDMLDFCKAWMSPQTRPNNLCNALRDKYLLMLGCGYGDWLFRFIWYCMNKSADTATKGLMAKDENTDETLVEYLKRIDAFLPSNRRPEEIIDEIARRLGEHSESRATAWFGRPPKATDVFISYSRRDADTAAALYSYLTAQGLTVWYDRNDLLGGSRFLDEINRAIENTKVFVPLMSANVAREAMDAHVYRKEWNKAIDLQDSMGARNFIIPAHVEGFDFYNADIPSAIKRHNSIAIEESGTGFAPLLEAVNAALNDLDNFHKNTAL